MSHPIRSFVMLSLVLVLAGCGSGKPVGKVAGKVTRSGQPLGTGAVVFENRELGVSVKDNLKPDGSFELKTADLPGLPPGEYRVAVTPATIGSGETPLVSEPTAAAETSEIPAKYHDPETSGLAASVKEGDNPPFVFDLQD